MGAPKNSHAVVKTEHLDWALPDKCEPCQWYDCHKEAAWVLRFTIVGALEAVQYACTLHSGPMADVLEHTSLPAIHSAVRSLLEEREW